MGKVKKTIRKAPNYLWNYAKLSGLLPDFDKKGGNKKEVKGGGKK